MKTYETFKVKSYLLDQFLFSYQGHSFSIVSLQLSCTVQKLEPKSAAPVEAKNFCLSASKDHHRSHYRGCYLARGLICKSEESSVPACFPIYPTMSGFGFS
jgi:hypothetical protein